MNYRYRDSNIAIMLAALLGPIGLIYSDIALGLVLLEVAALVVLLGGLTGLVVVLGGGLAGRLGWSQVGVVASAEQLAGAAVLLTIWILSIIAAYLATRARPDRLVPEQPGEYRREATIGAGLVLLALLVLLLVGWGRS
jgi:hypothetical protein